MTDAKALMPLAEVTSGLRILGQHDAGLRTIPIASIIAAPSGSASPPKI